MVALNHASTVLDWYENLRNEDVPPQWMWPFDELIDEYFKDLNERYRAGARNNEDDFEPDVPVLENEYARGRGRRRAS